MTRKLSAATRTRIIKQALKDAGYTAQRVMSTPASHVAYLTDVVIQDSNTRAAAEIYLLSYLGQDATVRISSYDTILILWNKN